MRPHGVKKGHAQKGMAAELNLSVNSVSAYVKALHAKLGVHSLQEVKRPVN